MILESFATPGRRSPHARVNPKWFSEENTAVSEIQNVNLLHAVPPGKRIRRPDSRKSGCNFKDIFCAFFTIGATAQAS